MGQDQSSMHGTTIIAVRRDKQVCIAGDGQVTLDKIMMKGTARKVRKLYGGKVIVGFAGATADAMTLLEKLEGKLQEFGGNLTRSAVELAKDWRTDRYLRRLEAMMIAADSEATYLLSGNGDVLEPDDGVAAIGSGGGYALAAARALIDQPDHTAEAIARRSLEIAGEICIYTNMNITSESLDWS